MKMICTSTAALLALNVCKTPQVNAHKRMIKEISTEKGQREVHFYYQAQTLCSSASPVSQPTDCDMTELSTSIQATCIHWDMMEKNKSPKTAFILSLKEPKLFLEKNKSSLVQKEKGGDEKKTILNLSDSPIIAGGT